jgi:multidrug resistance efflux pump
MNKQTTATASAKPAVGKQTFDNWAQAIKHATTLEMHGKISRRELNDVKTAARQAGHKC